MSALPPKADINRYRLECPLIAKSGHCGSCFGTSALCQKRKSTSKIHLVGESGSSAPVLIAGSLRSDPRHPPEFPCWHRAAGSASGTVFLTRRTISDCIPS